MNQKTHQQKNHDSPAPLVLRRAEDLAVLLQSVRARRRLPKGGLMIDLPGLEESQRRRAQEQLNALAHACGCAEGGALALIALLGALGLAINSGLHANWLNLAWIGLGSLVGVPLAAGAGKLAGKAIARLRFQRACIRLLQQLQAENRAGVYQRGRILESEERP